MNPSNGMTPPGNTPTSAGDEAALKAIEALEVESNQLPAEPVALMPPATPYATPPTPAMTNPTPAAPIPAASQSLAPAVPLTVPTTPLPAELPIAPANPIAPPTSQAALSLAASLRSDIPPATTSATFDPFPQTKKSKKPVVILIVVLLLIGLGVGGYFGWQYLQSSKTTPAATQPVQTVEEEETAPKITDTEEGINNDIKGMETTLDSMSDEDYSDTTLSDATLYN